jgi:hypothetical protein
LLLLQMQLLHTLPLLPLLLFQVGLLSPLQFLLLF